MDSKVAAMVRCTQDYRPDPEHGEGRCSAGSLVVLSARCAKIPCFEGPEGVARVRWRRGHMEGIEIDSTMVGVGYHTLARTA